MTIAATAAITPLPAAATTGPGGRTGRIGWTLLQAPPGSFGKTAVLLTGERDAVLVDGMFTLADGRMAAEAVRASGKRLTTILVTHGDPDYYFSLEVLRDAFPEARVLAAESTVAHIRRTMASKIETWGPRLGGNAPRRPQAPEVLAGDAIALEGERIELVVPDAGLPDRAHLWLPGAGAILGGVLAFAGLHAWTADTPAPEQRAAWRRALQAMEARNPGLVVPGHAAPGAALDASALRATREYLAAFETELSRAANSAGLITAMRRRFPEHGLEIALDIGARVALGEMRWG